MGAPGLTGPRTAADGASFVHTGRVLRRLGIRDEEVPMPHKWLQIASTPSVKAARERYGSAAQYARLDGTLDEDGPVRNDRLGPAEAAFIAERDGFYVASVSETGWPYLQFRGGPAGFLRVVDEHTLGYADLRGNRQYVTTGNVAVNDRVSLFLMDYAHQRRLKRAVLIGVEAFDWNCPQHITPRFSQTELEVALAPIRGEITALRTENERLKRELACEAQALKQA
jgi:uncharacterized protein